MVPDGDQACGRAGITFSDLNAVDNVFLGHHLIWKQPDLPLPARLADASRGVSPEADAADSRREALREGTRDPGHAGAYTSSEESRGDVPPGI